jgi:hypothetical protein
VNIPLLELMVKITPLIFGVEGGNPPPQAALEVENGSFCILSVSIRWKLPLLKMRKTILPSSSLIGR